MGPYGRKYSRFLAPTPDPTRVHSRTNLPIDAMSLVLLNFDKDLYAAVLPNGPDIPGNIECHYLAVPAPN